MHISVVSLAALGGGTEKGKGIPGVPQLYVTKDRSDYDRLRSFNNRIKHFDQDIEKAAKARSPIPIAPVWIMNDGFECASAHRLLFSELADMFAAQSVDAKNFSEI